jgi:hypothetical protein
MARPGPRALFLIEALAVAWHDTGLAGLGLAGAVGGSAAPCSARCSGASGTSRRARNGGCEARSTCAAPAASRSC